MHSGGILEGTSIAAFHNNRQRQTTLDRNGSVLASLAKGNGSRVAGAHFDLGWVTEALPDLQRLVCAGRANAGAIWGHCQMQRARCVPVHFPDLCTHASMVRQGNTRKIASFSEISNGMQSGQNDWR